MSNQPTVFISYSHEDEDEKEALLTHLSVLATEGLIDVWSDDQIEAGATWQRAVAEAIAAARVAIMLITANYLASDFIVGEQIPKLMQRRQNEGLTIFPIIAKACAWDAVSWLKQMDVRPKHGRPIWREEGRYAQEDLAAIVGEVERIFRKGVADSHTDDWVGTFLGRYQLLSFLGQGSSMARVYETFHPGLNLRMAIKVMDSSRMSDSALERFQDEAAAVARLHHNHIVRVYDFDQAKGKHYMVMDLIPGPTLETKLVEHHSTGQPFILTETVDIINALADALDYAHEEGVVHHDLKPANIMFTTNDAKSRLLLADFGIARIMGASNQTIPGMFLGTPNYASPEQAQGQRGDKRSDIYALGVILYELVTGRLPFKADTSEAVMRQHITQSVPPPTSINVELPLAVERVIFKALNKNPADRYQTAGELAKALADAVDEKTSETPHPSIPPPIKPPLTTTAKFNAGTLRQKLNQLLDDVELDAFCLDNFPQVYDKFSRGMRKDEKITLVLDYCRRDAARLQKLLDALQIENALEDLLDEENIPALSQSPLPASERTSLQRRLANLQENLRLIEERIAEFVLPSDVPLQLVRDKQRVQQQIEDITHQLGLD